MLRDVSAHPEAGQEHVAEATRLPGRDTAAAADPAADARREVRPAARLPFLDPDFLDPSELAPPDAEWPDPSWPGFAPGRTSPSYVITLAVSPWFKERYPDKAANLYDALRAGRDRRDPEPDLEAEP